MPRIPITFTVNGAEQAEFIESGALLIEVLREKLGLRATKFGCGQGTCGACTVLVEGEPMLSCIIPAERLEGRSVVTLEGLSNGADLHPLQRAFAEGFAAQCGFCTPGMIMAAKALLDRTPDPCRDDVIDAISGNVCRCTGYDPIITAILAAAAEFSGRKTV
jgi:aerobic carbon-monoxide dehydrogenase small subunit